MCAGMNLARLEGQVAIARFVARFPDYRLSPGALRGQRARFRGFVKLPCALHG
jgi:cytochrome P450